MPLKTATRQEISRVEADVWDIKGWAVDAVRNEILGNFRVGLEQPNGVVRWVREDANASAPAAPYGRLTIAELLAQLALTPNATLRTFLKALIYKVFQDAGAMPAGTIT